MKYIYTVIPALLIVLLFVTFYGIGDEVLQWRCSEAMGPYTVRQIQERNKLSRTLNQVLEKLGQMQCEQRSDEDISASGGWCQKKAKGGRPFDTSLTVSLADLFRNKTIGSFGEGPGLYRKFLIETGKVKSVDGYDGAPYSDFNTNGSVRFLDLTIPQFGLPAYDWVMSLEVIEHIPAEYERVVLSNIFRHAREGVVMSWAKEGQPGFHHVNCRNFDYVEKIVKEFGFDHDPEATQKLQSSASNEMIKQNVNVFKRSSSVKFEDKDI